MIKNEREYKITKSRLDGFGRALNYLAEQKAEDQDVHILVRKAQADAIRSQMDDLRAELEEYEALRSGRRRALEAQSLCDLPEILIRARIASGLTQRQLAERLELKEQQIQRYEASGYSSASLDRLKHVAQAIGIDISQVAALPTPQASLDRLMGRLNTVGIDREFALKRLIPSRIICELQSGESFGSENRQLLVTEAASSVGRVLGIPLSALFSSSPLQVDAAAVGAARFKLSAHPNPSRFVAYVRYAAFIAQLVLEATPRVDGQLIPTDPLDIARAVKSAYGSVSFQNALRYVWDLGIPVIPLNDAGVFHGACWRIDGRNTIVLKQRTRSAARWLHDLLHELWHASQQTEEKTLSIVELDETSRDWQTLPDEEEANQFAADVSLGGRALELAIQCIELAQGRVERMKSSVVRVAETEGVALDSLANYLAFVLAQKGHNWWGTATNLQEQSDSPWRLASGVLVERADLRTLGETDRELVMQALEA